MTQNNTPNFIRPGMTQDADPANLPHNQVEETEGAFAENDPATQAPETDPAKKPAGNPLDLPLDESNPVNTHEKERLQPGND